MHHFFELIRYLLDGSEQKNWMVENDNCNQANGKRK